MECPRRHSPKWKMCNMKEWCWVGPWKRGKILLRITRVHSKIHWIPAVGQGVKIIVSKLPKIPLLFRYRNNIQNTQQAQDKALHNDYALSNSQWWNELEKEGKLGPWEICGQLFTSITYSTPDSNRPWQNRHCWFSNQQVFPFFFWNRTLMVFQYCQE